MRLYAGSSKQFIKLNINNQIAELLRQEFFQYFGYYPSPNEVMSWRNSLLRLSVLFDKAGFADHGIFLEYQLPSSSQRLDCMICGKDSNGRDNSVIIELKQWEQCTLSEYDSEKVLTWVGGGNRDVLHPSIQVGQYKYFLENYESVFYEEHPVTLSACSFLHNYNHYDTDPLFDERFSEIIEEFPVYTADETTEIEHFLKNRVELGNGLEIMARIEKSKHRPSKKLMQHVSEVVKEKLRGDFRIFNRSIEDTDYILLDEQLIAYDQVLSIVKKGLSDKQKFTVIIKGGPGTGKSVIALKLLADLNAMEINAQYATGSKSFTLTLRKIVGTKAAHQFKYFLSYGETEPNEIDVLIMDEAHRIREKTVLRQRRSTGLAQIEELIKASKVSVFLIDDLQVVRPNEIGSSEYIREYAEKVNCKIHEVQLQTQFRCSGSDAFINWINNTLQIQRTANVLWKPDEDFEFKICSSPTALENEIREKARQGYSARVTAGFCWNWSKDLEYGGSLANDVKIGEYSRPWNARYEATGLRKDIPKAHHWAYDERGIDQVGCIYTAQGFEFDYVGVIFGIDLKYNPETAQWEGHPGNSYDNQVKRAGGSFTELVKNTYRVLMTRGLKGCYVYFMDRATENYFRSRIDKI